MTELEQLWNTYKQLPAPEREAFRLEQIWPRVKAQFDLRPLTDFDVSCHTVGSSPEPVILAALKLGAPLVWLLHTKDTANQAWRVQSELDRMAVRLIEVHRSDTTSVFTTLRSRIQRHPDARLAFDVTGGTKAMVAAVSMFAVHVPHSSVYYLENPRWDAEMRQPVPGFEALIRLELP
jgi:hypothetical protein